MTDARAVAEARRWFRCLGLASVEEGTVSVVATPEHPDTWAGNFATAHAGATAGELFAAMDRHLQHASWRVVVADALTPLEVEAALPLAGFTQRQQTVEMLARGPVASPMPRATVELHPVDDAPSKAALADLVRADHQEGDRTGTSDDAVSAGLLDLMQRRSPPGRQWLLVEGGEAVGYGSAAVCPGGLGVIEDLYTRPDRRRRGFMSAFIVAAVDRLRDAGCEGVFLDAHVDAAPQRLYASLGLRRLPSGGPGHANSGPSEWNARARVDRSLAMLDQI